MTNHATFNVVSAPVIVPECVQHNRPLRREADFGDGRHRTAEEHAREPRVEQADALNIGARKKRPEGAAKNIGRAQKKHEFDPRRAVATAGLPAWSW